MKRETVLLAQTFDPAKHQVAGWMLSVKMDGMRAIWDGGISRGMACDAVPYANITKDYIKINQPIATGLWTRYLKPVYAPGWFLDKLPVGQMLDGELWLGNGRFQELVSVVKTNNPANRDWAEVKYQIFDAPSPLTMLLDGVIDNPNIYKKMTGAREWAISHGANQSVLSFEGFVTRAPLLVHEDENIRIMTQTRLPFNTDEALRVIDDRLGEVTDRGGEGLMLRKHTSIWTPERSWSLLKVKRLHDDEGVVIGFISGRKTEKGSKLLGMIGALVVRYGNVVFELSGMNEAERLFDSPQAMVWASENPGVGMPIWADGEYIKRGSRVTFRYRDKSVDGIPKEARFLRRY